MFYLSVSCYLDDHLIDQYLTLSIDDPSNKEFRAKRQSHYGGEFSQILRLRNKLKQNANKATTDSDEDDEDEDEDEDDGKDKQEEEDAEEDKPTAIKATHKNTKKNNNAHSQNNIDNTSTLDNQSDGNEEKDKDNTTQVRSVGLPNSDSNRNSSTNSMELL